MSELKVTSITTASGDLNITSENKRINLSGIIKNGNDFIAAGGGTFTLINTQSFSANGTWTKPASAFYVFGIAMGAGGSGGVISSSAGTYSSAGGGGGGAIQAKYFLAEDLPSTVTVTVGIGGAAQTSISGGIGNAGTDSFFGSYLAAYGGGGGGYFLNQANYTNLQQYGGFGGTASRGATGVAGSTAYIANGTNMANPALYELPKVVTVRTSPVFANAAPQELSTKKIIINTGAVYGDDLLKYHTEYILNGLDAISSRKAYGFSGWSCYYSSAFIWNTYSASGTPGPLFSNLFATAQSANSSLSSGGAATSGSIACGGGAGYGAASGKGGDGRVFIYSFGFV